MKIRLILLLFIILGIVKNIFPAESNDMLFYVGEDTDVITIASGRPENPKKAPASSIILKDFTISEDFETELSNIPGFYIEKNNQREKLYFRGIPDSILFLYDGVPITSDITRSVVPLNGEITLNNLSKIEVVYGASSILWGPDAFLGVLNAVVKRGKEVKKSNFEIYGGSQNKVRGFYIDKGWEIKKFDIMTSFYYKEENKKFKTVEAPKSYYYEFVSKIFFGDSLNFTIRLSDAKNRYKTDYKKSVWLSENSKPFNLAKVEYVKKFNHSSLNFKGYILDMNFESRENGFKIKQNNRVYYAGLLYNKDFWNNSAMLTIGYGFRKNEVKDSDVLIRSFIPDYIISKTTFNPLIDTANFNTYLHSYYMQFRKHIKNIEAWIGYRKDWHSKYEDTDSFNIGAGYFKEKINIKFNYGLSYRTPFPKEFIKNSNVKPEKVFNLNLELNIDIYKNATLKVMGFENRIKNIILENNYAGYSEKFSENIYGVDIGISGKFLNNFSYFANMTFILNRNFKKEKYKVLDYLIIKPDFQIEAFFKTLTKKLDVGAKTFGNAGIIYHLDKLKLFFTLNYYTKRNYKFLSNNEYIKFNNKFLFNAGLNYKFLQLYIQNLFNEKYEIPGTYKPETSSGVNVLLKAKFHF